MLMLARFLVVFNVAQDFYAALGMCDSRTVAALHCLVK
jgi:hypothetical protein